MYTIMHEVTHRGDWRLLLTDATGATDDGNRTAVLTRGQMHRGACDWASDPKRFVHAVEQDVA